MKNPPYSDGGSHEEIGHSIASGEPCPLPCLYADQHHEHRNAAGHVTGTSCALCGQIITRSEWLTELLGVALDHLPPFPRPGERL